MVRNWFRGVMVVGALALGFAPAWAQPQQPPMQQQQQRPPQAAPQMQRKQPQPQHPVVPGQMSSAACTGGAVTFFIRQGAVGGTGTALAPFGSVQTAMSAASAASACSLFLMLGPSVQNTAGTYVADVVPFCNTTIQTWQPYGSPYIQSTLQGSIRNIAASPGTVLNINNLNVSGGRGYGIWQSGGILNIVASEIQGAVPGAYQGKFAPPPFPGFGVQVDGGAQAKLADSKLYGNAGGGLIVSGSGTYLQGKNILISANKSNGLYVTSGAKAHIRYLTVAGTQQLNGLGGNNILVNTSATLELHNFSSYGAFLSGIAIWTAYVTASEGNLYENEFGANIGPYPAPPSGTASYLVLRCLTPNVRSNNNRSMDLSDPYGPVPSSTCAINPSSPECNSSCLLVPYSL